MYIFKKKFIILRLMNINRKNKFSKIKKMNNKTVN